MQGINRFVTYLERTTPTLTLTCVLHGDHAILGGIFCVAASRELMF